MVGFSQVSRVSILAVKQRPWLTCFRSHRTWRRCLANWRLWQGLGKLMKTYSFSHNHGSGKWLYNYSWKVTILLEGHQFLTEPWLCEEVLSPSFEAINCYPKLFWGKIVFASGASSLQVGVLSTRYEGTMVIPGIVVPSRCSFPKSF